jgi:cholesterol oxidase
MLGVARNPKLWKADLLLKQMAEERGMGHTFRATDVGSFFGEAGATVPDPYFGGEGPDRAGCQHCGGCMVGCRHNAKNTLPKNYLYFAEKRGAKGGF